MRALGLGVLPSRPTLRQRVDTHAASWFDLAPQVNHLLLSSRISGQPIDFGTLPSGYTPADLGTLAMDNWGTNKELVGPTYAGVDGYCLFAVYFGGLGYCLGSALRPGVQHSATESEYNFERALPMTASMVSTPLVVRADSGFCSAKLMQEITSYANTLQREIAFIMKWNPRKSPVETMAANRVAEPTSTQWMSERAGKRECLWQEGLELAGEGGPTNPARRTYRLTGRTIDKHGNTLLLPKYVFKGRATTLPEGFSCE